MKRFFSALCIISLIVTAVTFATNRTKYAGEANESSKSYTVVGGGVSDTIILNDTVSYVYLVSHFNSIYPELVIYYDKVGSGNPTLKLDIYESMDNINWTTVKKGVLQGAYTKTYTPTADGILECSFEKDTAFFVKRYLKYQFSTGNTASTKAKLTLHQKINIR